MQTTKISPPAPTYSFASSRPPAQAEPTLPQARDSTVLSPVVEARESFWKALKNRLESEGPDKREAYLKTFGERLQMLRSARGLTQDDLAQHAGLVSRVTVYLLEAGKQYPHKQTVIELAEALKVSVEDLLDISRPLPKVTSSFILQFHSWKKQTMQWKKQTMHMNTLSSKKQKAYLKAFGKRLHTLRLARGLTQDDLAHRAGPVSRKTVWLLEAGKHYPTEQTALGLAEVLKVSVEDLLNIAGHLSGIDSSFVSQLNSWKKQKTCVNTLSTQERKDYLKAFGERLQSLRLARDLTQDDLARRAGPVSKKAIRLLEAGKYYPKEQTALDLAQALNITVENLLNTSQRLPKVTPSTFQVNQNKENLR